MKTKKAQEGQCINTDKNIIDIFLAYCVILVKILNISCTLTLPVLKL